MRVNLVRRSVKEVDAPTIGFPPRHQQNVGLRTRRAGGALPGIRFRPCQVWGYGVTGTVLRIGRGLYGSTAE